MTTDLLQMGVGAGMSMSMGQGQGHLQANTSLLTTELMEDLGRGLIQLCDKLEQHGLVDYQMGIWEEEILSGRLLAHQSVVA